MAINLNDEPGKGSNTAFRLGSRVLAGGVLGALLVVGCGGWAATAHLTGAVIASGVVKVDRNLKAIQHRDGGIVAEIAVREGDLIERDQILIRLDDVQTRAEISIVRSQLAELARRRARLIAERDGSDSIVFPLVDDDPAAAAADAGERRLFEGNRLDHASRTEQFEAQLVQLDEEVRGLNAQLEAKISEIALVEAEHQKVKGLAEKGLIDNSRVYVTGRERTQMLGERGEIEAGIARARARMIEIRLQIIAIGQNARTEAQRELTLVEAKMSELTDRLVAIEDRLERTAIRAPLAGIVNELSVHTIGGVITPAERLLTIVPENAALRIEARIAPTDIDQIAVGQEARLRFSSFHQSTTPELKGRIAHVSPATTRDAATGENYYIAAVDVADEIERLGDRKLLPGMLVDVFISTEQRTALSYLSKPLTDQFNRAFREE